MNSLVLCLAAMLTFSLEAFAQGAILAQATPAAPAQKSLAQQWGLYVFPAKKQTKETQDKDEYDCYQWAKQTSGIDPLAPAAAQAQTQTPPPAAQPPPPKRGGAVKGAAGGAAAGAAIGAIAGDAGKGAAIGAAAGGMRGAAGQAKSNAAAQDQAKQQQEQQKQQEAAKAQQATANTKAEFNKAFSVCLEGKDYTVK
jgi:hypothetical protein